mmetsp:Transcript_8403/g.12831  ORF Transcript_8403/g.12831 Transcript_8403/m.12831 type:complete len:205 (+) Transcript_8403:357-971(+)
MHHVVKAPADDPAHQEIALHSEGHVFVWKELAGKLDRSSVPLTGGAGAAAILANRDAERAPPPVHDHRRLHFTGPPLCLRHFGVRVRLIPRRNIRRNPNQLVPQTVELGGLNGGPKGGIPLGLVDTTIAHPVQLYGSCDRPVAEDGELLEIHNWKELLGVSDIQIIRKRKQFFGGGEAHCVSRLNGPPLRPARHALNLCVPHEW